MSCLCSESTRSFNLVSQKRVSGRERVSLGVSREPSECRRDSSLGAEGGPSSLHLVAAKGTCATASISIAQLAIRRAAVPSL